MQCAVPFERLGFCTFYKHFSGFEFSHPKALSMLCKSNTPLMPC
jgi:hypothetical protein